MSDHSSGIDSITEEARWMHVRETIRMLFLAIAQIEIALSESDDSVEHLTDAFTSMVAHEAEISNTARELTEKQGQNALYEKIQSNAAVISQKTQESIIAFQFYDKLTQRLAHVSTAMEELSDLLDDKEKINLDESWLELQSKIKSKYSMQEEHELFEAVIKEGDDVRAAIRRYYETHQNRGAQTQSADDIEFF